MEVSNHRVDISVRNGLNSIPSGGFKITSVGMYYPLVVLEGVAKFLICMQYLLFIHPVDTDLLRPFIRNAEIKNTVLFTESSQG